MADILSILQTSLIANAAGLWKSLGIGLLGFVAIGSTYCAVMRRRRGEKISVKLLLGDVFPRTLYRHYSARIDMWYYAPAVLFFSPLVSTLLTLTGTMIGTDVSSVLTGALGVHQALLHTTWLIVAVQFLGSILGHEFGQYVGHYALHRVPVLWSIHRAHHSAESLNIFTNVRGHPLEYVFLIGTRVMGAALGTGLVLYFTGTTLLPQTATAIALFNMGFVGFYTLLTHSHMPISFGGRFNILIAGPVMHQIHHSAELHHRDKNLGGTTQLFDWIFGTLYLPVKGEQYRWGLNAEEYGASNPYQTIRDYYFEPFRDGWRQLKKWRWRLPAVPSETGVARD